jgi:peptidoglycan/LPS O-acetylase OafA/YrhL
MQPTTVPHDRSASIDCLRGFSICWVLAYHLLPHDIFRHGNYGVLLFFIISGYCISFSAATSRSAWHFYAKRLGRLLPALVLCGAMTTGLKALAPSLIDPARLSSWFDFFYTLVAFPTLNVVRMDYHLPDGAYWSLQTEFQFYFIYACLIAAGVRRQVLLCLCAVAVYRTLMLSLDNVSTDYLPFFIAGVSVAAATEGRWMEATIGVIVAFSVDLYQLAFHMQQPSIPPEISRSVALWIGTVAIWAAASFDLERSRVAALLIRPLSWVGLISYPLYLIHQDVGMMLVKLGLWRGVVIALLILISWVIYFFVERKMIRPVTNAIANPISALTHKTAAPRAAHVTVG